MLLMDHWKSQIPLFHRYVFLNQIFRNTELILKSFRCMLNSRTAIAGAIIGLLLVFIAVKL